MTDHLDQLRIVQQQLDSIAEDAILRPTLGTASLSIQFAEQLKEIKRELAFVLAYGSSVHSSQVDRILHPFRELVIQIAQQAERPDEQYVPQKNQFLNDANYQFGEVKRYSVPFVAAAVKARGFLEDEGIKREYKNTIQALEEEKDRLLTQVKAETKEGIDEAKALAETIEKRARRLAETIEKRARRTASGISVKEAQEQFTQAQEELSRRVWVWVSMSVVSSAGFFLTAVYFLNSELPEEWQWHILYQTAIKITILTAIGTAASFCFKILRAHLHMSEKNRHRQRVANSISSFVESAVTPEQRDQILSQLVESVVQFGTSGLLQREEENLYKPKMTIDSITRNMTLGGKGE